MSIRRPPGDFRPSSLARSSAEPERKGKASSDDETRPEGDLRDRLRDLAVNRILDLERMTPSVHL